MNKQLSHIDNLYLPPYSLNLITTNYCTAACKNCCLKCSPRNNHRLSYEDMKTYIDDAQKSFPTIKLLVLTGGECFSLQDDLRKIINYGSNKGLDTRVVTNAYWASSFKKAYMILKELVSAGLKELNVSTGDEHQIWIDYDNVIYATVAALDLNLTVAINVETTTTSNFTTHNIYTDVRLKKYLNVIKNNKLKILGGKWVEFKDNCDNEFIDKQREFVKKEPERCNNLLNQITINQYHKMIYCCGLSIEYIPYLMIGCAKKISVKIFA